MKNKKIQKGDLVQNEKGQALLFVVVAMTVALTVGIGVSQRALSSLRRTTNVDTASRVFSAAEGGVEWFLRQPMSVLDALADGDTNNGGDCPAGTTADSTNNANCVLTYTPQANDNITALAQISVETFSVNYTGGGNDHYWFNLDPGDVKEVKLFDIKNNSFYHGNLDICWKSTYSDNSSGLYYLTYAKDGIKAKGIISPSSIVGTYSVGSGSDVTAGSGRLDFSNCYTVNISTDVNGIRFKSLFAPSKIGVFPGAANFPMQGYAITSTGRLGSTTDPITASKVITTYRSLPYAPSVFDYALYSVNDIN